MNALLHDLRYTLRQLRKSPGFTAIAVLILAFGIGATTAFFSIVDGVLLRPLPFPNSDRLVTLGDQVSNTDWGQHDSGSVTAPEVIIYPRDTRSFESLGGYDYMSFEISGIGEPAQINASRMTPSVFSALGVGPLMGRVFTAQEDQQKAQVAVLSYGTWKSRFNGDPHIMGTKILLDREPYVVIGVMPRNFEFPLVPGHLNRSELWVPMSLSERDLSPEAGGSWYLQLVGRLKPGITQAQAESDALLVAQEIMRNFPPELSNFRFRPVVYPLQQITVLRVRPMLRMLFLAVSVVLLISCANFAGLLLVRAIRRRHETAVRLAIGVSAVALLRQMMLESLALSVTGGLLGIGFAALALATGKNYLPETLPLINEITLNWTAIGFALLLAILTGLFCGLAPGFVALRTNVNGSLKQERRSGSASGSHARLRSTLVVAEIAVALTLLAASGLLMRSFSNMSAVDLGFRPDHVTTAAYALPEKQYSTQAQIDTFNNKLLLKLRQSPGVISVGLTDTLPTTGDNGTETITVQGYVDPSGPDQAAAPSSKVIGDYFKAIGTPLIRGRYFEKFDNADNQLVVIVNRKFAEYYWPGQNPIGKQMRENTLKSKTPWMTVVGEVADARLDSPDADAAEQFYQPVAQLQRDAGNSASPPGLNGNGGYIVVRSALPAEQMENVLRATVRSIDAQLPLTQIETMEQAVAQSEAPRRFNTVVISSFAFAAVLLAGLGIYSIIAFSVASRTQEIAIRMALGSRRWRIVRLVLVSGAKLGLAGCGIGAIATFFVTRLLRPMLFQVDPFDPIVIALAAISILLLALAASVIPARRAASIEPMQALRTE